MERYISKSALVAEIERLYDEKGAFYAADVLYNLKEWLDTTEVKEAESDFVTQQLKENSRTPTFIDAIPKFKIGQTIKKEGFNNGFTILKIENGYYYNTNGDYFPISAQDQWELVREKCKGCNNFSKCDFCMNGEEWAYKEEKGSKELEKEIENFFNRWMEDSEYNQAVMPNYECAGLEDCRNIARHFANWQKQQFEKNRLKHCNSITNEQAELEQGFIDQHLDKYQRMPTYLDAIEYGMKWQKEQMMAKAVDAEVHIDAGGYPYIPQIELYDYCKDKPLANEGDKYKVVLIKEE